MIENFKLKPGENKLSTEIVSDIQNNFRTQHVLPVSVDLNLQTLCSPHVQQKEELLTKIYLYKTVLNYTVTNLQTSPRQQNHAKRPLLTLDYYCSSEIYLLTLLINLDLELNFSFCFDFDF